MAVEVPDLREAVRSSVELYYRLRCWDCFPKAACGSSAMERELLERARAIAGCVVVANDRQLLADCRRELDVLALEKKTAIEFDGLFWHSV